MEASPSLPFAPAELQVPLGGRIRVRFEDFEVDEVPLYEPTGEGSHLLVRIEKRGLTTPMAVSRLAAAARIPAREVGWAGYKDRAAVTRQWLSFPPGSDASALRAVEEADLRVLELGLHPHKLRTGHLRANRFRITVRDGEPGALPRLGQALEAVRRRGLPNGFGAQRFGRRGDNHLLGEALVRGDPELFMERLCAPRPDVASPSVVSARERLLAGEVQEALRAFPPDLGAERHLAQALRARPGNLRHAVRTLPPRMKSLLVSAWQSEAFNRVLARRLESFDELMEGDVAWLHRNGACFRVADPESEAPRALAGEISPSGPLPGRKMMAAEGRAGVLEAEVLGACGALPPYSNELVPSKALPGARRPLRVPVPDLEMEPAEDGALRLSFTLPAGSFATALLALFGVRER